MTIDIMIARGRQKMLAKAAPPPPPDLGYIDEFCDEVLAMLPEELREDARIFTNGEAIPDRMVIWHSTFEQIACDIHNTFDGKKFHPTKIVYVVQQTVTLDPDIAVALASMKC